MKSFGIDARDRRQYSDTGDGFRHDSFILSTGGARDCARSYFSMFPPSIYLSEIESWQKLPDGRIAFALRRLHRLE
jgi:hypothetical protein